MIPRPLHSEGNDVACSAGAKIDPTARSCQEIMLTRRGIPVFFEAKPNLMPEGLDKMPDAVYTLMHNVMNGLPRRFRVLDRRILSFPDAVRGEMAASIPWMAALERWMASPNAGCPLFCVPGGSGRRDGHSGSKMAAREDK